MTSVKAQGLLFNSNDSLLAQRTSYDVFSGTGPEFRQSFSINFDLSIWDRKHFGYIFSLRDQKSKSYSLSYIFSDDRIGYLYLNIDNESQKIRIPLSPSRMAKRQWIPVQLNFDLKNDKVVMKVDSQIFVADKMGLNETLKPRLVFGKYQYFTDVPSMAIKNLWIRGGGQEYNFPLNEWQGSMVHTREGKEFGTAENPNWLINDSWFWKEKYKNKFSEIAGLAYIDSTQQILIYQKQKGIIYDLRQGLASEITFQNELPVPMILGKSQYNPRENKIYVYEANNVPIPLPTIAALDLSTLSWQTIGKGYINAQRHHHNSFYDKSLQDLYLFGGYGSFTWFNQFFKYNPTDDKWEEQAFSGDSIMPRFFSAASKVNEQNELLIFGGFGNQSGSQIVGGKHLYDLYKINLSTKTIHKLWEITTPKENFVPANNLVISPDGKYFYVICYAHHIARTSLQLLKFRIADGTYELVSSPIPVISEKIETDINLFYNSFTEEFYCAVQEFSDATHSTIKIYSLSAPPVSYSSYVTANYEINGFSTSTKWVLASFLLTSLGLAVYLFRKQPYKPHLQEEPTPDEVLTLDLTAEQLPARANAVYLTGEFAVFDRKQRDITHLFSPKLRQLFVLILLNQKDEQNGVSSKQISQVLWPDKEPSRTKNLRGVTLNNLRSALNDLEGIKLLYINDSYCFERTDDFFCDYLEINQHLQNKINDLHSTSPLLNRGTLLPEMDEEWLDEFKSRFASLVLERCQHSMNLAYKAGQFALAYQYATIILYNDPFHEEAIACQLTLLKRVKGMNAAKKRFDAYVLSYEQGMGVSYPLTLDKIDFGA
ncbi:hypothetical protein DVR12_20295 [Chitinophaga silvatica]|uniref:Uncharacterized protein n=1 Tax=Chitinophaga silvatica TaxID=2282649 RepID=A0A3E1Y5Q3_9BACT|nr:hypothetical protein [Chitinophaga silvatica]RFS20064.1 hypothetical protein DVR12_20295 [Chitinophaga silvatica]